MLCQISLKKQHWRWLRIIKWTLDFLLGKCCHKTRLESDFYFKSSRKVEGKKAWAASYKTLFRSCKIMWHFHWESDNTESRLVTCGHLWSSRPHSCACLFPHWRNKTLLPALQASSFLAHYWGNVSSCGWTAIVLAAVALGSAVVNEA